MHVFISYAKSETRDLATQLQNALAALSDVTSWMDSSLSSGEDWATQIQDEIDRADLLVVLLSPDVNRPAHHPNGRSFVLKEIHYAQQLRKTIIPVLAQSTRIPVQLAGVEYVDFTHNPSTGFQRLIREIKKRNEIVVSLNADIVLPLSPEYPVTKLLTTANRPIAMRRRVAIIIGLLILAIGLAVIFSFALNASSVPPPATIVAVISSDTPTVTETDVSNLTSTATATLGDTPTASLTPWLTLTPSATVPSKIPKGGVFPFISTKVFPPAFAKGVQQSILLLDQRRYGEALPTLVAEITNVAYSFDPAPYYFAAIAYIGEKRFDDAYKMMLDAKQRLSDTTDDNTKAVVIGTLSYTSYLLGKEAMESGLNDEASSRLYQAEDEARNAMYYAQSFDLPYLTLSGIARVRQDYERAIMELDQGLALPNLAADVKLIVEKGEIYFEQMQYDKADYQAFLALYIAPNAENAHELRIKSAMAQGKAGLAVLYSQAYLYYYPGSTEGYMDLAQSRAAEGKDDLALLAFSQALVEGDIPDVLQARAAYYSSKAQYKLAQVDLSKAFNLTKNDNLRARRMEAAYAAGDMNTALSDVDALLGMGTVTDAQAKLVKARILVDKAKSTDTVIYKDVIDLLSGITDVLPSSLKPISYEYQAKSALGLRQYDIALNAINLALDIGETGTRHYIRGMILESQGKRAQALRDYDWIMKWSTIYIYPFLEDVKARIDKFKK